MVIGRTGAHLDLAAKAVEVECNIEAEPATIHIHPGVGESALDHRMNLGRVTYAHAQVKRHNQRVWFIITRKCYR